MEEPKEGLIGKVNKLPELRHNLVNDLLTIEAHKANYVQSQKSIMRFQATSDEVIEWYFVQDPIQELDAVNSLTALKLERPGLLINTAREYKQKTNAYAKGAAILVSNIFVPEAFTGEKDTWIGNLTQIMAQEETSAFPSPNSTQISTEDVIEFCLKRARDRHQLSDEELYRITLAGEMLHRVAISAHPDFIMYHLPSADKYLPYAKPESATSLGSKLWALVVDRALKPEGVSVETKLIGLSTFWSLAGNELGKLPVPIDSTSEYSKKVKKQLLLDLTNLLDTYFLGEKGIIRTQGNSPEIRGKLHELVWFLDANMLQEFTGRNFRIFPAMSFQDRPIIGHPKSNRAFDFFVLDLQRGVSALIQLKSRPQPRYQKEYHPLIYLAQEQNFMDINPSRLHNKLKSYHQVIESEFDASYGSVIDKYVLPSVKEVFEKLESEEQTLTQKVGSTYNLRGNSSPLPVNREMRRNLKKFLKRIK